MNNIIELKKIKHIYGNHIVFNDLDLTIKKGEFICVYGPSGSGKTSLLNIIGQLQKPFLGKVYINEILMPGVLSKCDKDFLRHEIAYLIPSLTLLDNKTVMNNFKIDLKYKNEDKYIEVLESVRLSEEILTRKIYTLSGGEKLRVALAIIKLKNNGILLADEPTASLDPDNAKCICDMLKSINESGVTVIAVTHDEAMLKYATRVINLNKQKQIFES